MTRARDRHMMHHEILLTITHLYFSLLDRQPILSFPSCCFFTLSFLPVSVTWTGVATVGPGYFLMSNSRLPGH